MRIDVEQSARSITVNQSSWWLATDCKFWDVSSNFWMLVLCSPIFGSSCRLFGRDLWVLLRTDWVLTRMGWLLLQTFPESRRPLSLQATIENHELQVGSEQSKITTNDADDFWNRRIAEPRLANPQPNVDRQFGPKYLCRCYIMQSAPDEVWQTNQRT